MTNNEAEFKAILIGLDLAKVVGASLVVLHSDSQVVIRHINGDYRWFQRALTGQLRLSLTLRTRHFPKTPMIESSGNTFCADSEYTIQERFLPIVPKVFDPRWSELRHKGSPWKGVQKPLRGAIIGPETHTSRVLLTYNAEGCPILREGMWQVSTLQQCHKATVWTTHPDECPMALRSMTLCFQWQCNNSSS